MAHQQPDGHQHPGVIAQHGGGHGPGAQQPPQKPPPAQGPHGHGVQQPPPPGQHGHGVQQPPPPHMQQLGPGQHGHGVQQLPLGPGPQGHAPAAGPGAPVTIGQIRDLLAPVCQQLDNLTGQVATLQKKKPDHVVDVASVKWKKEGTKLQYKAWTEAWDHVDRAKDAVNSGNQDVAREALEHGINFIESKMRDVLCANTYGWDWVQEYNAPPLSKPGEDEAKFRKTSKAVSQKRLEREFSSSKKVYNQGTGDRYANLTCNNCGLKGHIWSGCPARTGSKTTPMGQ